MKWKIGALVLAAVLLVSIVPAALAASAGGSSTTAASITNTTGNSTNSTRDAVVASQLIKTLNDVAGVAERVIGPLQSKLPANSSVLVNYREAEEYKEKAVVEYSSGDYCDAILDSLTAMHHYRAALAGVKDRRGVQNHVRMEIERTARYLQFAKKTIDLAERQGINVENATLAYNATIEAYRAVLADLKEKNFEKARDDLQTFKERKAVLDRELRVIRSQLAEKNSDKFVKAFLRKGQRGIEIVEKAIQVGNEKGYNTTRLQESLNDFLPVYNDVKTLAAEGKWDNALRVIRDNGKVVMEFHRTVSEVLQKEKSGNSGFIRTMKERINRDERGLTELKKKGVDVSRAELLLKTASQEFNAGVKLMQSGRRAEAKAHFELAVGLLNRVEEFIIAHS